MKANIAQMTMNILTQVMRIHWLKKYTSLVSSIKIKALCE